MVEWSVSDHVKSPTKKLNFAAKVFTWIENFLRIRNKAGQVVPFHYNTIQQILAQHVAWCWHVGIPVKLVTPKSRQQGSSSFWEGLFFALAELRQGFKYAAVAHTEEGARIVFSKSTDYCRFLKSTKAWSGPYMASEQGLYLEWSSKSIGQGLTIRAGDALGKGDNYNAIHFSESANFSDRGLEARKAVTSITSALSETSWTFEIHESTAKGKDPFFWELCEEARDPDSGSTFFLIFLPWFLQEEYTLSWEDYRRQIMLAGGRDPGLQFEPTPEEIKLRQKLETQHVAPHEESYRYNTTLTDGQLVWRRWAIKNKCSGDEDLFKRYFPSFYEEAFTASASCAFSEQTIEHYRQNAKEPSTQGNLIDTPKGPFFDEDHEGPFKIWQMPEPLKEYVLGGDPGGDKSQADPCNLYVVDKHELEVVAQVHGHFEWDHFADMAFSLGMFYNEALLVMENNVHRAVSKRLHRRNYPNLFYYFDKDRIKSRKGKEPGFNMNRKTRPEVIKLIQKVCRDRTFRNPDKGFWLEMETFVWVPKASAINPDSDGEYRATGSNHDDRIMSAAIAIYHCPHPIPQMTPHAKDTEEQSHTMRMFRQFKKWQKEQDAERIGDRLNL